MPGGSLGGGCGEAPRGGGSASPAGPGAAAAAVRRRGAVWGPSAGARAPPAGGQRCSKASLPPPGSVPTRSSPALRCQASPRRSSPPVTEPIRGGEMPKELNCGFLEGQRGSVGPAPCLGASKLDAVRRPSPGRRGGTRGGASAPTEAGPVSVSHFCSFCCMPKVKFCTQWPNFRLKLYLFFLKVSLEIGLAGGR